MATSLRNRLQATALAAMACILFSPLASRAEVTYRLVTSDDQILDRCVYIMAAPSQNIAAGKASNDKFRSLPTCEITIENNIINETPDIEEFALKFGKGPGKTNISDEQVKMYPWVIKTVKTSYDMPVTFFSNTKSIGLATSTDYSNSKIILNSDNTVSISSFCGNVAYNDYEWGFAISKNDYILNSYAPASNDVIRPQLYRKDVYNLHIIDQKAVYSKGDEIKIHTNIYSDGSYNGMIYYCFNDGTKLTNDEIWNNKIESIKATNITGEEFIIKNGYPGGNLTLWVVRDYTNSSNMVDILRVDLKETLPVTSIEAGHFAVPQTEGYSAGQQIEFERQDDVKIYYTLDGNDPVIPSANSVQTLDESEDHSGKTYDLDERPLTYDGSPLSVRFVAIKSSHAPSEIHSFSVAGTTTSLETIERDDDSQAEYFTLQGIRLTAAPSAPGIYLRKSTSGKVQKIIIR